MRDVRVERLARLLVEYSLRLGSGDVVRLDGSDASVPLLLALQREALRAGAHPYLLPAIDGLAEILLEEGSDEQLAWLPERTFAELDRMQAHVTIWADVNTKSLSEADATRQGRLLAARRELSQRRMERISGDTLAWCGTLYPTQAHAQDADMSLAEFEDFVYAACHVHADGDPVAHWRAVSADLNARAEELARVRELRIVGPDTDLRLGVGERTWIAADGRRNMPDGEVFTSPVETETSGEIRYTLPAAFQGREVEDVRLRFDAGRVVAAEAASGGDYLASVLEVDGARVLGEVAFGLNYEIDRATRNILFDEKIGGTMHLALGAGFPMAGGSNVSAVHWDMICDLRAEGEVYADGELIWKAGAFLAPPGGLPR
jgi:aminopeptidase